MYKRQVLEGFRFGAPPFPVRESLPPNSAVIVEYLVTSGLAGVKDSDDEARGRAKLDAPTVVKRRQLPLVGAAEIGLQRTANGQYRLTANLLYRIWSYLRFSKHYPAPRILTDIAAIALLEKGLLPLHCAAVERDGGSVALFAPPDTGKTYTTMRLIERGWKFISEDIAIADGAHIFGCPFTGTLSPHSMGLQSYIRRAKGFMFKQHRKRRPIDMLDSDQRCLVAPIRQVLFLEKGKPHVEEISKTQACDRILRLNRYEFRWLGNDLLLEMWMRHGTPNLQVAAEVEQQIVCKFVAAASSALVVYAEKPTQYEDLIAESG